MSGPGQQQSGTLASLEPHWPVSITSPRLRLSELRSGSFQQLLRKPSKLPDVHRPYVVGDPINRIDWRVYGRTDALVMRDVRDEANARVLIVYDQSPSMFFPSAEACDEARLQLVTKFECAIRLAFHLGYAHFKLGDGIRLFGVSGTSSKTFVPRTLSSLTSEYQDFVLQQFTITDSPEFQALSFEELAQSKFDLIYVISDFLDQSEDFFLNSSVLSMSKSGPLLMHVLSSLEQRLDWLRDDTSYFDQRGPLIEIPGRYLRQDERYQNSLSEWKKRINQKATALGGDYLIVSEQSGLEEIHNFLTSSVKVISGI